MGTFYVGCKVDNYIDREKNLSKIGVKPAKKEIPFIMANGQSITRTIGFAIKHVNKAFTITWNQ